MRRFGTFQGRPKKTQNMDNYLSTKSGDNSGGIFQKSDRIAGFYWGCNRLVTKQPVQIIYINQLVRHNIKHLRGLPKLK